MHDAIAAERLGLPAVGIMTHAFVSAAQLMARVLGAPGYRFATIDHPISSATDNQLKSRAINAAQQCHSILTQSSESRPVNSD